MDQNNQQEEARPYTDTERLGEVARLKGTISAYEKQMDKAQAFLRLEKNPDFIKIIEEGFCKDLALNAVRGLGTKPTPEIKADLENVLQSVGILMAHFEGLMQLGSHATQEIAGTKDELARIESLN